MRASAASSSRSFPGVPPFQPDHGVDLVQRPVGGDAQIVFLAPLAAAERGEAVVAGAGVDPVEYDHPALPLQIAQMVTIMTMIAMNCISTRRRISFCEGCGEPPRIRLMEPNSNTTATTPTASGTRA